MSAQPVHHEDPLDPEEILVWLPERERETFLAQYREAHASAADPARYGQLTACLTRWSRRAELLARVLERRPNYYEEIAAESEGVRNGSIPTGPIEEVLPDWPERLAAARGHRQT